MANLSEKEGNMESVPLSEEILYGYPISDSSTARRRPGHTPNTQNAEEECVVATVIDYSEPSLPLPRLHNRAQEERRAQVGRFPFLGPVCNTFGWRWHCCVPCCCCCIPVCS